MQIRRMYKEIPVAGLKLCVHIGGNRVCSVEIYQREFLPESLKKNIGIEGTGSSDESISAYFEIGCMPCGPRYPGKP